VTAIILTALVVIGLVLNGLRLRSRIPSTLPAAAAVSDRDWVVIGSPLDDATRAAATSYAQAEGLTLLDLVPADLPVTPARDLLRRVDPKTYRKADRLAAGRSAGAALLVATPLLDRAGTGLPEETAVEAARRIRPYADPCGAAIVVAPSLRAAPADLDQRRALLAANGVIVPIHLLLDAIPYVLTVIALITGWQWGLAAAVAYCLQPYLIFAGTSLHPRGLPRAALLRPLYDPYVWVRTAAGRWRSATETARDAEIAAAVPYYREALADGTERFLEERRADCPWCGSAKLSEVVRSRDLVIGKPGTFTLERCDGCGHVFQNPRLRPEGLDFYYRDAYDGLGLAAAETVFVLAGATYRERARILTSFAKPKAWLDVGAGHAHFCAVAGEIWPDTVFDGLDQGAGIQDAERRGWITTGFRGEFRDLADTLAGRYDVVSMHHYLEHTRDPLTELDAAARVLPPGGFLLIELPDPEWPLARLLGQYWIAWFQPQHQHMMPLRNLCGALAERGFRPVTIERGPAHQANDFVTAALLLLSRLAPDRRLPWSVKPPRRAWHTMVWVAGLPVIAVGLLLDRTLGQAIARSRDRGDAYRVLSVRESE
jgi:SAM-dependent methyltransferase